MSMNEDFEANRTLNSILRILVESYEQTAAHSSLMIRDSDLRAGDRYLENLSTETKRNSFYLEVIVGTAATVILESVIDRLPPRFFSNEYDRSVLFFILAVAIFGFLLLRWRLIWRTKADYQALLSKVLQDISDTYSIHSALSVRLQRDKQLRVALEAILLPLSGKTWGEIRQTRYIPNAQQNIDQIAEIDRQRMLDLREYNRKGGDFKLELLQSTLRSELPGFVCTYLELTQKGSNGKQNDRNLNRWRKEAKDICKALYAIDKRFSGNKTAYDQLLKVLDSIPDFSERGLNRLLAGCRGEPFNYAGPRAKLPAEFFSSSDSLYPSPQESTGQLVIS